MTSVLPLKEPMSVIGVRELNKDEFSRQVIWYTYQTIFRKCGFVPLKCYTNSTTKQL